jgi:2-keto-4-pentenoate hydratase/2-oxohepta-3-ene-1,7-dioic acid hydratase in catechol pathway
MNRREFVSSSLGIGLPISSGVLWNVPPQTPAGVTRFVRFRQAHGTAFGILEGKEIHEIRGDLFGSYQVTSKRHRLAAATLLCPIQPPKILGIGFNYPLEIGKRRPPDHPEMFYKPISAVQNPGDPIVWPEGATRVAYESEMVVVIGKTCRKVSIQDAPSYIFGVTCGNDVSEREWQEGENHDLQWWRGKGCDTFAPFGPVISRGLDYNNLKLEGRLNGKTVQQASTSQMIYSSAVQVSFVSQYLTLVPGDIIYTGTPGATGLLRPGDVFEVELEGVGVLRNPVVAA